jgi:GntR family transcriptional regulator
MMMAVKISGIERDSPLPLWHQLEQLLLDKIDRGVWKPGELIPGEQELQEQYGLSRTTVRQALRELELAGRVTRYRGRGTFVSAPKLRHSPEPKRSLALTLMHGGMTPGWRVLSHGSVEAPREVAERLGCEPGADVYRIARLRLANDEPLGLHVAHVAPAFRRLVDESRIDTGGSLEYLNVGAALDGSRAERVLEAVAANAEEADLLDVEPGAPMLRIRRLVSDATGAPVEDLRAVYRGDRFEYHVSSLGSLTP